MQFQQEVLLKVDARKSRIALNSCHSRLDRIIVRQKWEASTERSPSNDSKIPKSVTEVPFPPFAEPFIIAAPTFVLLEVNREGFPEQAYQKIPKVQSAVSPADLEEPATHASEETADRRVVQDQPRDRHSCPCGLACI
jgi:hypothetical protein